MSLSLVQAAFDEHSEVVSRLKSCLPSIVRIAEAIWTGFETGGTLYAVGNGGSASESMHFVGEMIGRYKRNRRPLPAVALCADPSVSTCIANDYAFSEVFSRQIEGLVRPNDIVVAFSTSGTSQNIQAALTQAKAKAATTILFTGERSPDQPDFVDFEFRSPTSETARIQEMHQLAMHMICDVIDPRARF